MIKKLLAAMMFSLCLTGCNQAPKEQEAQRAKPPISSDSTLLDSQDSTVQLADSVQHLD